MSIKRNKRCDLTVTSLFFFSLTVFNLLKQPFQLSIVILTTFQNLVGAPCSLDVTSNEALLSFNVDGEQQLYELSEGNHSLFK